jgi:phage/plasmid-like protein (TIGR03299 family)
MATYTGALPWAHGAKLDELSTKEEMIEKSGLNWTVRAEPLKASLFNGMQVWVPDTQVVIREDNNTALSVVGPVWTAIQNDETFTIADAFTSEAEDTKFMRGGLSYGGVNTFIVLKVPGELRVRNTVVDEYFLLTNSFDGSAALTLSFTAIARDTSAIISIPLNKLPNKHKIRHSRNAPDRIKEARRILGFSETYFNGLDLALNNLCEINITDSKVNEVLDAVMPFKATGESARILNIREQITTIFNYEKQQTGFSTGWELYRAFTTYADHFKTFRGEKGNPDAIFEKRFHSVTDGPSSNLKEKVFSIIQEL